MEDNFQAFGICPSCIDLLNNFVIAGVMVVAVALSIVADTPSGPFALFESREASKSNTSSSSHRNSLGHCCSSKSAELPLLRKVSPKELI